MDLKEIEAALTANPELKSGLIGALEKDVLDLAKTKGFVIRSKDEDAAFLNNYETTVIPSKVDALVGEKVSEKMKTVLDGIDAKVFELTGQKKGATEKTTEFVARMIAETKAKGGGGSEQLQSLYEQAQSELQKRANWVEPTKLTELQQKYFADKVNLLVSMAQERFPIAVPAHITDEAQKQQFIETQKRFIKMDLLSKYTPKEDKDGNVSYYEGDKVLMNTNTGKPMTEAEIIEANYSGYFVPKQKSGGAGSDPAKTNADEASLQTKEQVYEYVQNTLKLAKGGSAWGKEVKRILSERGITK